MTPPNRDREAWEYIGQRIDELTELMERRPEIKPRPWIATWGPALLAIAVAAATSAITSWATVEVLKWRVSANEMAIHEMQAEIKVHKENWRVHKLTPKEDD